MMQWRISPTAAGFGYLIMLIVLMLVAVNYSNNLIFTLCFLLSAVMLLSVWMSIRNLHGFSASQVRVKPVHAGQPLEYQIALGEHSGQHHLYLTLRPSDKSKTQKAKAGSEPFYHLRSGPPYEWTYQQPTEQRGSYRSQALKVDTVWPLGIFRVSRPLIDLPDTLVYPHAQNCAPVPENISGQAAHAQQESEELSGLREYQPGDNLRRIHWRAASKGQPLQVKEFDGAEGDPSIWLNWQDLSTLEYEARIRTLCHRILECQQHGQEFGLKLPGIEIAPERGSHHIHRCLKALALMPEEA